MELMPSSICLPLTSNQTTFINAEQLTPFPQQHNDHHLSFAASSTQAMAWAAVKAFVVAMAVVAASLSIQAAAQAGCTTALISLAPCLSYISGNSSTPSSSCCSQLASVVQSQPQCLCSVLNGGASSFGITINQTQALALPVLLLYSCVSDWSRVTFIVAGEATEKAPSTPATPTSTPATPTGSPATPTTPATPNDAPPTPSTGTPGSANGSKSSNSEPSDGSSIESRISVVLSSAMFAYFVSSLIGFF
ncbi:hypothetical protein HPP92_015130 [Vanilla planifolia]|uniref:Bifunctional inhibitor/plant lipid transfer protein/seed storage helical domain-containing protein n=1 Tax=Vanilla planifolia TaxID=51239 RepID=A0A835QMS4_VANPL|nr:hypothetical protein HPP92_015130 [Vanilla planifolia]